ncbi:HAD family hydrolase [Simiduia aestuariiviva]|uniref:HAD superfamily hydrolase (TIGR01490 family) n=1 Tax=Simiduia aestuariiviva TaxID=1510459 RepID=A0A839UX07_9GAMM|nr:HAD family hydrolase [Simiduia aestuariiviva]MBB3169988.1 HAD superfamily hydrolase (TIGR01490 family) [Simiduia aestuariiviva]
MPAAKSLSLPTPADTTLDCAVAVAIFDLDNTLIAGDSDHSWGEFLVERQLVDADHYRRANDQFYEDYKRGELDIHAYQRFVLQQVAQFSAEQQQALLADFMTHKIAPLHLPKAQALLEHHRAAGDFLLIITATNRFITAPIAEALQVDQLIATEPEIVAGQYTGEIIDPPCYQAGKVTRWRSFMTETKRQGETCYFYSDSINDLPLLTEVDHPVAVDPCPQLNAAAEARGWPIISLR